MPEIITVSLSHRANHLNTHFFNGLESFLDYSGRSETPIDFSVYNSSVRNVVSKTISYSPRLMLWDLENGFGALDETQSYEDSLSGKNTQLLASQGVESWDKGIVQLQIDNGRKSEKSPYQKALDNMTTPPKLTLENTRYWSDYSRLIYPPRSFNTLKNWVVEPEKNPKGKLRCDSSEKPKPFDDFSLGVEEWSQNGFNLDYLDEKFRPFLEEADTLAGLNLVVDGDSGWAGILHEMLPTLKDEFFTKPTLFSWGLFANAQPKTAAQIMTRIRALVSLAENSSLVIPMTTPLSLPRSFTDSPELRKSFWFTSALDTLAYSSLMHLFCNKEPTHMVDFELSVTQGSKRNIISEVASAIGSQDDFIDDTFITLDHSLGILDNAKHKTPHIFSRNLVVSPPKNGVHEDSLVIDKFGKFTQLREGGVSLRGLTCHTNEVQFPTPDTFPLDYVPIDTNKQSVTAAFSTSSIVRSLLLEYTKKVKLIMRKNTDEKEELVEKIATLSQEYEWGYESDSDWS